MANDWIDYDDRMIFKGKSSKYNWTTARENCKKVNIGLHWLGNELNNFLIQVDPDGDLFVIRNEADVETVYKYVTGTLNNYCALLGLTIASSPSGRADSLEDLRWLDGSGESKLFKKIKSFFYYFSV